MTIELALAFIGFAFATSVSPGPANFLLLASGANFGLLRTTPLILGVCLGASSIITAVGLGLGQVMERFPLVYDILRVVCGAYILWLAYKISQSRSLGKEGGEQIDKPISFIQAAFLQLLNPKAWTVSLILTVTFVPQENYVSNLMIIVGLFILTNIPSISIWAISGAALRTYLSKGNRIAVFNVMMAILLVGSMFPLLLW